MENKNKTTAPKPFVTFSGPWAVDHANVYASGATRAQALANWRTSCAKKHMETKLPKRERDVLLHLASHADGMPLGTWTAKHGRTLRVLIERRWVEQVRTCYIGRLRITAAGVAALGVSK